MTDDIIRFDDTPVPDEHRYTVQDAINAMPIDPDALVPPEIIFGLSGLTPDDITLVKPVWQDLPQAQRVIIIERLTEQAEVDHFVDYETFARFAYSDPTPAVRVAALNANWADESLENLHETTAMAEHDLAAPVRAAALTHLSKYLYLAEIEEFPAEETQAAQALALQHATDSTENADVQRLALEALAHTTHARVAPLIETSFSADDPADQASALRAMGHTCDPRWGEDIIAALQSPSPEVSLAALFAAGNIGLTDAVPHIKGYTDSEHEEHRYIAVWALGETGSQDAIDILIELLHAAESADEDNQDDDWLEALEDALENARMMNALGLSEGFLDDE